MRRERSCAVRALLASRTSRGLLLVLIERVKELEEQLGKEQGFGVIVRPVWVPARLSGRASMTKSRAPFKGGSFNNYFSSSSSFVKPTAPYCISSSRSASASGDLALLKPLIVGAQVSSNQSQRRMTISSGGLCRSQEFWYHGEHCVISLALDKVNLLGHVVMNLNAPVQSA